MVVLVAVALAFVVFELSPIWFWPWPSWSAEVVDAAVVLVLVAAFEVVDEAAVLYVVGLALQVESTPS